MTEGSTKRDLVRRIIGVWALLAIAMPASLSASAPDDARAFIQDLSGRAIEVLGDESLEDAARREKLAKLFKQGFDTESIGIFVLGRHWRRATRPQLKEYIGLFEKVIVTTYSARLKEYGGETLKVKSAREASGDVIVISEIVRDGKPPVRVDWRVRDTEKGWKIIDVILEGVSMALTQRDEFAAVLRQHNDRFDGLLAALRERAGE